MIFLKLGKLAFLGLIFIFSAQGIADIVVIVHAENPVDSIKRVDLGRIFLGKSDAFDGGGKAVAVNQIGASASRGSFDAVVLKKTTTQMNAYWSKQMFSGRGNPPQEFTGDLGVLQHIASDKTSIGYIDEAVVNGSVKVLSIID